MLKKLLQEDDCAPDAYESFASMFHTIVGISVTQFKQTATIIYDDELAIRWESGNFVLEYAADDPYYALYKKEN